MSFNSYIPAYATCFAGKDCAPVRSTWGTSLGEDELGARARILNSKVARRATIPPNVVKEWHQTDWEIQQDQEIVFAGWLQSVAGRGDCSPNTGQTNNVRAEGCRAGAACVCFASGWAGGGALIVGACPCTQSLLGWGEVGGGLTPPLGPGFHSGKNEVYKTKY